MWLALQDGDESEPTIRPPQAAPHDTTLTRLLMPQVEGVVRVEGDAETGPPLNALHAAVLKAAVEALTPLLKPNEPLTPGQCVFLHDQEPRTGRFELTLNLTIRAKTGA